MGHVHVRVDTGTRNRVCDGGCKKTIQGDHIEYFLRASNQGCGKNYCSDCVRKFADQIDRLNKPDLEPGGES